jgi:ABC-type glycerol-3-phosphate transport system substrate-binding protein
LALNSYDPLWVVPWLWAYGGWLTDQTGQPTLNTPAMESALTLYLGWQGRLTGLAPVQNYDETRTQFLRGDIAMLIDGEWAIAELARAGQLDWGVAPLPRLGQVEESQAAAPLVLARYWSVSRSTTGNRALAAAAFLEHITHPKRQLAWTAQFGLLPTRRQALDDPLIVNDATLRASAEQMRAGRAVPLGANADIILNAMREPLKGVLDGELTPQEAAEMMQESVSSVQ